MLHIRGLLSAVAFGNCWPQLAHTPPTGPVWGCAGVVSLPGSQNRTQGHTGPSLVSPPFPGVLLLRKSRKLALQVVIHCLVNGEDRVKQRPVSRSAVQSPHGGGQRFDEILVLQLRYVLPHRVGTHACVFPNFPKARVAQVGFPVLTKQQVCVHSDLACAQSQGKNLVWQKEKSSLPWLSLASPSHIFSANLHPVFQIPQREAFSLFYAAQFLREGQPSFWDMQTVWIAPIFRIKNHI